MRAFRFWFVSSVGAFAIAGVLCGKAQATTCANPTITSTPSVSFGTSVNVYNAALGTTVLGPFTVTGNCTSAGGGAGTYTFTISYGPGNNLTSGNLAMKCTTACTFADVFQYYICADVNCNTKLGNGASTQAASCAKTAGNHPCTSDWSVQFYVELIQPVAHGTNDSSIGQYTDTVSITAASP